MTWPWKLMCAILYMLPWVDVTEKTVYFIERFPAFHWTEYFTGLSAWGSLGCMGKGHWHRKHAMADHEFRPASVPTPEFRITASVTQPLPAAPSYLPHPHIRALGLTVHALPPSPHLVQSRLSTGSTSTSGLRSSSSSGPTSVSCATRRSPTLHGITS